MWTILLAVVVFLLFLYRYLTSYIGVWEKVGVSGPKPRPIINHLPDLANGFGPALDKWEKQFGKTYGIYGVVSKSATLVTTDLDILNHVLVKDFDNFVDHPKANVSLSSMMSSIFFQMGNNWRRQRHVITPLFTSGKMKLMFLNSNESAMKMTRLVKTYKAKGNLIQVKYFAQKFTGDIIARSGFGVDAKAVEKEDNEFSRNILNFFKIGTPAQKVFLILSLFFPWVMDIGLRLFNSAVDVMVPAAEKYFVDLSKASIARKKEEATMSSKPKKTRDMLDFLLDAETDDVELTSHSKVLTRKEIIGNSLLLVFSAFETTSTAISNTLYLLAKHPDIQDRVVEEMDAVLGGSLSTYDQLTELKYMDQVITESLRLLPPIGALTRAVNDTKTYNGVTIPKGTNIFVPMYKILKDPDYWPEPEKFDPDRFGPDKKAEHETLGFITFGFGPRMCVGKKMAIMNIKVALCHLLSDMRFVLTDRTEPNEGCSLVQKYKDNNLMATDKPILLDVVMRNK